MISRILLALSATILPLLAQADGPDKKPELEVKFLAEQFPSSLGKVYLTDEKTRSEPFELPINTLSEPVPAPARTFDLKLSTSNVSLSRIVLPDQGKSFAVILVTAKPAGFKALVVRTDDPSFRPGDVFFINRSEKTILGKLGTTPLVLKPGESKKDRPVGPVDDTYYDIAFATRDETGDKVFSSSRWPIDNDLRSYLFFFTNAQGKTTFRAVDEYLSPGKP
jgi:hypothetical protein